MKPWKFHADRLERSQLLRRRTFEYHQTHQAACARAWQYVEPEKAPHDDWSKVIIVELERGAQPWRV